MIAVIEYEAAKKKLNSYLLWFLRYDINKFMHCNDLLLRCNDLLLRCNDLLLRCNDLLLRCNDLQLRSNNLLLRSNDLMLSIDDHLIVFFTDKRAIPEIENYFREV